jgi:hypothetical protein
MQHVMEPATGSIDSSVGACCYHVYILAAKIILCLSIRFTAEHIPERNIHSTKQQVKSCYFLQLVHQTDATVRFTKFWNCIRELPSSTLVWISVSINSRSLLQCLQRHSWTTLRNTSRPYPIVSSLLTYLPISSDNSKKF